MKKYNYVYITTNLITEKQYIGDHSTDNLNDLYLGSGDILKKSLSKYGKNQFEKIILEQFGTKEQAFLAQEKYIKEYNTLTPNGYNISPKGGHNVKDCISEETRKKISKSRIGFKHTDESKNKMSLQRRGSDNAMYGKGYLLSGNKNGMYGKTHSEEIKQSIREKHIGFKHTDESKNKMSLQRRGSDNAMYEKSSYDIWIEKFGKDEADRRKILHQNKLSKSLKGRKVLEKTKKKQKEVALNRKKIKCAFCRKSFTVQNIKKHIDKCSVVKTYEQKEL